jgi:N-acetylmuramoyl-L-alanine amidase
VPAPAATAAPADIKPASSGPAVLDMRVGEHPGKTRIVLDVRGKTSFTSDLDRSENILLVELPEAAWNAQAQKSFSASPLISSYRVEPMGDKGTLLVIQLKAGATISYKGTINNPDGGQRIVIDIASAN